MRALIALLVVIGGGAGCFGQSTFHCTSDSECGSPGTCERAVGLCSFPDPSCSGGSRFGELSGAYANQCVTSLDAGIDAAPDAPACIATYGSGLVSVCLTQAPPASVTLSAASIDTDSDPGCLAAIAENCVIAAHELTVSAVATVTGSRALVLVAEDVLTVPGTLDASSTRAGVTGAGASQTCAGAAGKKGAQGGGGGAGGSFGGAGGDGGDGGQGTGGAAASAMSPTTLHGGCAGGTGGDGQGNSHGGAGGNAGGVIYLIAGSHVDVTGNLFASGAGGQGGAVTKAGGGGGGTGGLIGLDAPVVTVSGTLAANGGAGGGGAGTSAGSDGQDGVTASATPASGGTAGTGGTDGGSGTAGATTSGGTAGGASGGGGGGGGGGAGIIRVFPVQTLAGTVSPPPT